MMSAIDRHESPVKPSDESSLPTVRNYVKDKGLKLSEEEKVDYLLSLVKPDAIFHVYRVFGKTFSQEAIKTIIEKTYQPVISHMAMSYLHPYQIVSSTKPDANNVEKLLEYYIDHPNNEMLMQSILNRQLDVSPERLMQLSEHIEPEVRIVTSLHYNVTEQIVEKIWDEDSSVRSGLLYSNKLPLRLVFEKLFSASDFSFRRNRWEEMKKIHGSRPEWKSQLVQVVQNVDGIENLDELPVEWLVQIVDLFVKEEAE